VQEVELLRARFGGEVCYLRPAWRARARYPRPLLGLHRLAAIRRWDSHVDIHHLYSPQLFFWLPVLRFVTRPVVYTVTAGLDSGRLPPAAVLRRFGALVVPSHADLDVLHRHGLKNVYVIRPGVDLSHFTDTPAPAGPEFILLSGSAPWTREQFQSKGVDTLLEVARRMPDLRLVFLWRGVLLPELVERVRRLKLSERVAIVSEPVDVSRVLAGVHAAVVLASRPGLVKAYPHSLLEALAAGRPVLVNAGNPMAEYVRETGCGRVVSGPGSASLLEAIGKLRQDYEVFRARAVKVGGDFSREDVVAAYRELYHALAP
jgi:glycosyltransferase involved in cell wall biosynthesis